MMRFLEHRIGDPRVLRLIAKWLKAGVMEEGTWTEGTVGTPQGAVISPLLANIYCTTSMMSGRISGANVQQPDQ
jgi:retron-type reverse transcriptase